MCVNPQHFRPLHVYRHDLLNSSSVTAGCGRCLECREIQRNEWVNRLCFEYDANKNGCCVFLTFTYNNAHLPSFHDGDFSCLCFNHNDVKSFLKSLENYYYYMTKTKPYKYFWAAEYGKNTRRPHYHCLFFLDASIASDWMTFVEVCREIWCCPIDKKNPLTNKDNFHLGYMFPKASNLHIENGKVLSALYLDEKGENRSPYIQDGVGGMTYASKYATKDMSFYSDEINAYLSSENGYKLRPFLPKHWQSKKIGYAAVDAAAKNVVQAYNNGIVNPLTLKVVPLPHYVANKLLYVNKWRGRYSPDGVKLYDRELSEIGRRYMISAFESRVVRTAEKMSKLFQCSNTAVKFPDNTRKLLHSLGIYDLADYRKFLPVALFHNFYKNYNYAFYYFALSCVAGSFSDLLDYRNPIIHGLYLRSCDTAYKRLHPFKLKKTAPILSDLFGNIPALDDVYCSVSRLLNTINMETRVKKRLESYQTKEQFTHGFPLNLC